MQEDYSLLFEPQGKISGDHISEKKIIVTEMLTFIVLETLKILKLWVGRTEFLKEMVLSCSSTINVLL